MATQKETRIVEREIARLILEHEDSYHGVKTHKKHNNRGWYLCKCVIAGIIRSLHDTFTGCACNGEEMDERHGIPTGYIVTTDSAIH